MGNPFYRGIYAYDDAKKPVAPATSSPFYRGIYTFDDSVLAVSGTSQQAKQGEVTNER